MPFVAAAAAVVGTAVSVKGAVDTKRAGKRQRTAQRKIQQQQKRLSDIKAARDRRRIAREGRIARAKIVSATGGEGGSRAAGVSGSVATQTASALGFAGQQQQAADTIFSLGGEASAASADLASAQSLIGTGSALVSAAPGIKAAEGIFSTKPA